MTFKHLDYRINLSKNRVRLYICVQLVYSYDLVLEGTNKKATRLQLGYSSKV